MLADPQLTLQAPPSKIPTVTAEPAIAVAPAHDLAAAINTEYAAGMHHIAHASEHFIRCGELLLRQQESTDHGEWLPWLKANCPEISERTAQVYMQIARACRADSTLYDRLKLLTLREVLKLLSAPKAQCAADSPPQKTQRPSAVNVEEELTLDAALKILQALKGDEYRDHASQQLSNFERQQRSVRQFRGKLRNAEAYLALCEKAVIESALKLRVQTVQS